MNKYLCVFIFFFIGVMIFLLIRSYSSYGVEGYCCKAITPAPGPTPPAPPPPPHPPPPPAPPTPPTPFYGYNEFYKNPENPYFNSKNPLPGVNKVGCPKDGSGKCPDGILGTDSKGCNDKNFCFNRKLSQSIISGDYPIKGNNVYLTKRTSESEHENMINNLMSKGIYGGLIIINKNKTNKSVFINIDDSKPPCLPGSTGACSPADADQQCNIYEEGDTTNIPSPYTIVKTNDGKSKSCSWDTNDSNLYNIIGGEIDYQPQPFKSYKLEIDINNGKFIQFPRDEDGFFWWCNQSINDKGIPQAQRICPGLGLYVTDQESYTSNCMSRFEFNINVNKNILSDNPYELDYTFYNLSSVDGINSAMSVEILQNLDCISNTSDKNKITCNVDLNNTDCNTLTKSTQGKEIPNPSGSGTIPDPSTIKNIPTCSNPSHLNYDYQNHLSCLQGGCVAKNWDQPPYTDNDANISPCDTYQELSYKPDCHRYWDVNGDLSSIEISDNTDSRCPKSLQTYREKAQQYLNMFKDQEGGETCETYMWAFNEQHCSDSNCNNSTGDICDPIKVEEDKLYVENSDNPLKQCPMMNPYVNKNLIGKSRLDWYDDDGKPSITDISGSYISNNLIDNTNYLFVILTINDVITSDPTKDYIISHSMCNSSENNLSASHCTGKDDKNPWSLPCNWDAKKSKCHDLSCPSLDEKTCTEPKSNNSLIPENNQKYCIWTGSKCEFNQKNYNMAGLCSGFTPLKKHSSIPSPPSI